MSEVKTDNEICFQAKGISKIYPGTKALQSVDFNIYQGKVNVLIGENGAGKSTLMKIIAGIEKPTSGSLTMNGEEVVLDSVMQAEEYGIGIIHQELNLFSNLNIYQNIFMAHEYKKHKLFLDNKEHLAAAMETLNKLEHPIDPNMKVSDLRVGQQQMIEIAKAVAKKNLKILIMDEPTSSLSTAEVEVLFKVIRDLTSKGISLVYISHRMGEIMQIGDYVTVLRDGKRVDEQEVKNVDIEWMVNSMLGHQKEQAAKQKREYCNEEILRVQSMSLMNTSGTKILDNVSFNVKKGEILGIYGLLGAGRTEIFETLMGMHPEATGTVFFDSKEIKIRNINEQIKRGFAHIPEDRQREGLIQTLNIAKNTTIASLEKYVKKCFISSKDENEHIDKMIKDLHIRVANKELPILSLSGGNQQKVVISKYLLTNPKIILLDEPTKGIDVGAKEEMFNIIKQLADQGITVILIASELREILSVSDRIIVLSNGKLTAEFTENIEEWQLAAAATSI